jgi:hypothetical protein
MQMTPEEQQAIDELRKRIVRLLLPWAEEQPNDEQVLS